MKYLTKTTFILITFLALLLCSPQPSRAQLQTLPRDLLLERSEKATTVLEVWKEKLDTAKILTEKEKIQAREKIDGEIEYLKERQEKIKNIQKPQEVKQQAQEMQKRLRNFQLENKKKMGLNLADKLERVIKKLENIKNKLNIKSQELETELTKAKEFTSSSRASFTKSKFAEGVKMIRQAQQNLKNAQKILRMNLGKK